MFMDHWSASSRELESVGGGSMTMDQIPGRELESAGGGSGSGY